MAKKRLLTWHKPTRRWKKQIDGVVRYFGHGQSEVDLKAYKAAEQRYLSFLADQERSRTVEVPLARATLGDVCEKFMQQLELRHRGGHVSASYVCRATKLLEKFVSHVGAQTPFKSVGELVLEGYRNEVLAGIRNGGKDGISPWTAKERLSQIKSLFTWAWEMRLCEMPRNLKKLARVELPEPQPQIFTNEELQLLWENAQPRMRCFIALGLNCGYGAQDIADLRLGEINFADGYIERCRSKTKVRARHKLWSLTLKLLKPHVIADAAAADLAFRTPSGSPLMTNIWDGKKLKRSDTIKCAFWRLMRKAGLNGGRGFYNLRKTGATMIERINPAATEMYLAHAERGMRKHYAERNWDALAAATDEIGRHLNLKIKF